MLIDIFEHKCINKKYLNIDTNQHTDNIINNDNNISNRNTLINNTNNHSKNNALVNDKINNKNLNNKKVVETIKTEPDVNTESEIGNSFKSNL